MKRYSFEDDVIVAYDREEYLKEVFEANIEYAVEAPTKKVTEEVIKEVTEKNTLDMAKKMKLKGIDILDIESITGLSKEKIEEL